jgi:HSP20 family protein
MKLIRYNYPEFTDVFSDFDRFFRSSLSGLSALGRLPSLADSGGVAGAPRLAADLYEDDDHYYTRVELPGAKRKDVKVELQDSVLTITYEHKAEGEEESEGVAYKRSLSVPEGVDGTKVSAALKNGILTVTLPRSEKKAPKEILIG